MNAIVTNNSITIITDAYTCNITTNVSLTGDTVEKNNPYMTIFGDRSYPFAC